MSFVEDGCAAGWCWQTRGVGEGFQRSSLFMEQLPAVATFVGEGMVKERVGGHM